MSEMQSVIPNFHQAKNRTLKWLQLEMDSLLQKNDVDTEFSSQIIELESKFECLLKTKTKENLNILQMKEYCELKKASNLAKEKLLNNLEEELALLKTEKLSLKTVSQNKVNLKQLTEESNMFSQHLGLKMTKVKGGWLQFVFTLIDVNKPDSCYFFSLKVDSSKKYIVADCQPEIKDMDHLVEKLNSTNNLKAFVHAVRRRFVSSTKNN
ncbi:kinetochore protein Spc25-like isoform X2 [Biomphalaria glabrata]|uniref:Kinetochore protein SPC25 n=1 Tax=Biomphalaria glabrata TaxID=6526 RepID=A0A9U8EIK0_BIOGL|nr:kinetochore protein Spc25-like isoform X2 [Biomphalaria glabrata]